jgi:hypothetical protein
MVLQSMPEVARFPLSGLLVVLVACSDGSGATTGGALSPAQTAPPRLSFTPDMISGKSLVSSGYSKGYATFHADGSMTCTHYPEVIDCKTWRIDQDGTLIRHFDDKSSGRAKPVRTVWTMASRSGTSFEVIQTTSNSDKVSVLRISHAGSTAQAK